MSDLVEEIVEILVSGISSFATGFGTGLGALVKSIFVVETVGTGGAANTYTLTVFGGVTIVFMSISLAISLCRFVLNWVTSLGK